MCCRRGITLWAGSSVVLLDPDPAGDRIRIHNTDNKIPNMCCRREITLWAGSSFCPSGSRSSWPKSIVIGSGCTTLIIKYLLQARDYTLGRKQFGRPLAANQLIQKEGGEEFRRFFEMISSTVLVPRMSALFFHRPPIYERATDHKYAKRCSYLGKTRQASFLSLVTPILPPPEAPLSQRRGLLSPQGSDRGVLSL